MNVSRFVFRQLFEELSNTYTYVIGCARTKQACIIDPVLETVDRDLALLNRLGLNLAYAVNTHCHADHVTGTGELKKRLQLKTAISANSGAQADWLFAEGDAIKFGDAELLVRSTPGHTDGCVTFVSEQLGCAFTGDALLIGGCGRTDFQQGNPAMLYDSVHSKILSLPDDYLLFPAHDYKGLTVTTVGEEKAHNPRLTKSKQEFVELMNNLGLAYPKQIDKSVPANQVCGVYELMDAATQAAVKDAVQAIKAPV